MTDAEREARELAIQIWGKWAYDHEYGDRKDRERAKIQHNAKISYTASLLFEAIKKVERRVRKVEK